MKFFKFVILLFIFSFSNIAVAESDATTDDEMDRFIAANAELTCMVFEAEDLNFDLEQETKNIFASYGFDVDNEAFIEEIDEKYNEDPDVEAAIMEALEECSPELVLMLEEIAEAFDETGEVFGDVDEKDRFIAANVETACMIFELEDLSSLDLEQETKDIFVSHGFDVDDEAGMEEIAEKYKEDLDVEAAIMEALEECAEDMMEAFDKMGEVFEEIEDSFEDVDEDDDGYEYIMDLKYKGLVDGYDDGTFKPDNFINRAEFLKIVLEVAEYEWILDTEITGSNCFKDVADQWFAEYVCTASSLGFVDGYSDGYFRPEQTINFVEASKIISNVFELNADDQYVDDRYIDTWYQKYVVALEKKNAIPYSILKFDQELTRFDMAEIMYFIPEDYDYYFWGIDVTYSTLKILDNWEGVQRLFEIDDYEGTDFYAYDEIRIVSDSTLVTVGKLFAKAAGKPENYFKKSNYTKGAKRLAKTRYYTQKQLDEKTGHYNKGNRYEAALAALEEKDSKLLILSAGINDIQSNINKTGSNEDVVYENLRETFDSIVKIAHQKGKKVALFLIYRKGKIEKETPAQTKAIDNTIKRINDWIKDKNSSVDMVIDPEKLPEGSFADRVHFNNNGAKTVLANLQTELIKSKETNKIAYKGALPISTPKGYERITTADLNKIDPKRKIQKESNEFLNSAKAKEKKDPEKFAKINVGKLKKTTTHKGKDWLLVLDVHTKPKPHLGISAFPKKA